MIKPGYKTSEFWFTLVSFLFSGLYLLGLLDSNHQKEDLIQETSRGLEALILIIGQLTVLFRYVKGRSEIKKIVKLKEHNNDTERTYSRTNRKNNSTNKRISKKSKKSSTK